MMNIYGLLTATTFLNLSVYADRPEIKQDTDTVIDSGAFLNVTHAMNMGDLTYLAWATCDSRVRPTDQDQHLTLFDGEAFDPTIHIVKAGAEQTEGDIYPGNCNTKHLMAHIESPVDLKVSDLTSSHTWRHAKYMVADDATQFIEAVRKVIATRQRSDSSAFGGNSFKWGGLYRLANSAVEVADENYWHFIQIFGPQDKDDVIDGDDVWTTFEAERASAGTWMKMSDTVDQRTPSLVASGSQPVTTLDKTDQFIRWSSCVGKVDDAQITKGHVLTDTKTSTSYLLESASTKETFQHITNCRHQVVSKVASSGIPNVLTSMHVVMHMEYEVLAEHADDFAEKTTILTEAIKNELEFMFVAKSLNSWNGNAYFQMYQVFASEKQRAEHQKTKNVQSSGLSTWVWGRNAASREGHKWGKLTEAVNTASKELKNGRFVGWLAF